MIDLMKIRDELLEECEYIAPVELWSLIWKVRFALNGGNYPADDRADPNEIRQLTIDLARLLLSSGRVNVGEYSTDGNSVTDWALTSDQSIARIISEWDALGHEPGMADIVAVFFSRK